MDRTRINKTAVKIFFGIICWILFGVYVANVYAGEMSVGYTAIAKEGSSECRQTTNNKGKSKQVKVSASQKKWYKKVLNSKTGSYYVRYYDGITLKNKKKVKRSDFIYYKLVDLNKDGIQELLLATDRNTTWKDNRVLLLTYYNGKVVPLICFEGAGARGQQFINNKVLIFVNSGSDYSSRLYITVSKGKLKTLQHVAKYRMKDKIPYYTKYMVNNKKVSEAEYQKADLKYSLKTVSQIEFKRIIY